MLGLLLAALGVIATFAVMRTRWRVRHSLYESLRNERQRQIQEARDRSLGRTPQERGGPGRVVESGGSLTVRETTGQTLLGHAALVVALLLVLLGVLVLIAAEH